MLKLGEKGAILQRDKQTYAIAPHIPCGMITPELLRKIADVSEKYNAQAIKITGATRVAIIGLEEGDIDSAWEDLALHKGAAVGLCVRSARTRTGTTDWASRTPSVLEWPSTAATMARSCPGSSRWPFPAAT